MNKQGYAIPKCNVLLKKTLNGYLLQIESRFSDFSIVVKNPTGFCQIFKTLKRKGKEWAPPKNSSKKPL
jgi:hypothetical protein